MSLLLVLADFDSAEWFSRGVTMSRVVVTLYYVAPEGLSGREYNEQVEVWTVKCWVVL